MFPAPGNLRVKLLALIDGSSGEASNGHSGQGHWFGEGPNTITPTITATTTTTTTTAILLGGK
eukprot:10200899-Heterocapsa_arctica.AAC.1